MAASVAAKPGFWDNGPFYQHLPSFPGFGIESTADTVGTTVGTATLLALAPTWSSPTFANAA